MWAIYAILGAFAKAFSSVIRKKIAKTDNSVYIFISSGLITIILVVLVSFIANQSLSSVRFAPLTLLIAGLVQIVAIRANLYAFKYEELSYITPMFALTPLYAALIAYFTIGETPSTIGILGIVAIVVGVYAVTTSKKVGVMSTFIRLFKNKGARAGMLIPIAYAVSATLNKDAINHGVSPIASVAMISGVMNLSHSYVLFNKGSVIRKTVRNPKILRLLIAASITGVASVVFASLALNGAFTSYALGIRRMDVLITVVIGWKFMGDSNFLRRLIGASVMTAGVVLIILS